MAVLGEEVAALITNSLYGRRSYMKSFCVAGRGKAQMVVRENALPRRWIGMSVLALATSAICVNAFLPPNSANMKHMDRRDGPGKRKVSRKAPIFENTTRSYHLKGCGWISLLYTPHNT
jgi:hypothetical protein